MPVKRDALSYSAIDFFEGDDRSESELFHESTKLTRANMRRFARRTEIIMRDPQLSLMMTRSWKSYAGAETTPLPRAQLGDMTLQNALRLRRSVVGAHAGGPITMQQLASLLDGSYGVTSSSPIPGFPDYAVRLRAAASAGGLHPLEIYPLVLDVEGCAPGVYHYRVADNRLELVKRGDVREPLTNACSYPDLVRTGSVMFAITAVLPRTISKYAFRGYRFISYDVGVLLQNLYLVGTALGLGTVAVGGFYDDEVGQIVGVDGVDEHVMMLFSIGRLPGAANGAG